MNKDFSNYMDLVGRKHGHSEVFSDFLTFTVCCLSAQEQEELYLKTAKKYTKDEMSLISEALGALILEMDNKGEGLKDCLGEYFMLNITKGRNGQFFTPQNICDMMVQLSDYKAFSPINDPCCGSGRMFLAAAKTSRFIYCYGEDLDYRCCQMTLVNMCLNGIYGVVTHRNSLTLEAWNRWEVMPHPTYKVPYIHRLELDSIPKMVHKPAQAVKMKPLEFEPLQEKPKTQMALFMDEIDYLL